jgi:hypothetical protein
MERSYLVIQCIQRLKYEPHGGCHRIENFSRVRVSEFTRSFDINIRFRKHSSDFRPSISESLKAIEATCVGGDIADVVVNCYLEGADIIENEAHIAANGGDQRTTGKADD